MATASTSSDELDHDERALQTLLDAFGSSCSLEDINTAYCEAGGDVNLADEILNDGLLKSETSSGTLSSNGSFEAYSNNVHAKYKAPKPKKHVASMGTVSTFIDRNYAKSSHGVKPPRIQANGVSSEGSVNEERNLNLQLDSENFLFQMFGPSFQLDRGHIQEVLGHCGYDMKKSLDLLLDLTRDKIDRGVHELLQGQQRKKIGESPPFSKQVGNGNGLMGSAPTGNVNGVVGSAPTGFGDKHQKSLEVLKALFDCPRILDEPLKPIKRRTVYSKPVENPPNDGDDKVYEPTLTLDGSYEEGEDNEYDILRSAVSDYHATMRGYYEAAAEAFDMGDHSRAKLLREKGFLFFEKARECREEASKLMFKIKGKEAEEPKGTDVLVDLQNFGAKEAIHFLKYQLRELSGMANYSHMKITLGRDDKDVTLERRRRVIKLFEKESIKWTEGSSTGTMMVRIDEINPQSFSFAKKH